MSNSESLDERSVFSGKLGEVVQTVQPDGRVFERFRRPPGVRIVIISGGRVLLTEEYRRETGDVDLRLPGGKVFDNKDSYVEAQRTGRLNQAVEKAVRREALEEVGILVSQAELLTVAQAGATVEWDLHYFLVRDFAEAPGGPSPEKDEDITPRWLRPEEIIVAIRNGQMSEWRSVGVMLGLVFPSEFPASDAEDTDILTLKLANREFGLPAGYFRRRVRNHCRTTQLRSIIPYRACSQSSWPRAAPPGFLLLDAARHHEHWKLSHADTTSTHPADGHSETAYVCRLTVLCSIAASHPVRRLTLGNARTAEVDCLTVVFKCGRVRHPDSPSCIERSLMSAQGYVFSYVNPDTDGVACSIGYTFIRHAYDNVDFEPLVWGDINAETKLVLDHFQIAIPARGRDLPAEADLVLVDTHHPAQLAPQVNPLRVVEIIDHHPAGSPEAFPNAIVQNEQVGAAATLLAERIVRYNLQPDPVLSGLLAAAIISNTYNLAAPSTTTRDRQVLDWLRQRCHFDEALPGQMLEALSSLAGNDTPELMLQNYKKFLFGARSVGIVQIETALPNEILTRTDLLSALSSLRSQQQLHYVLLSIVDLASAQTYLITTTQDCKQLLEEAVGARFAGDIAIVPKILMRKTDLVPILGSYIENRDQRQI